MARRLHATPTLRLTLTLPAGRKIEAGLRTRVATYLRSLGHALGLPGAVALRWQNGDAALSVGGESLPLALDADAPDAVLEQGLAEALYRGRELLWTPATLRHLWSAWFPERQAWLAEAAAASALLELLREAARWGFSAECLQAGLAALTAPPPSFDALVTVLEDAAAAAAPATLRIEVAASQQARWFDVAGGTPLPVEADGQTMPELLEKLAEDVFNELGLVLRCLPPTVADDLVEPSFRLRWNDIPLPVLKGLAADELLAEETPERLLASLAVHGEAARNPAGGSKCSRLRGDPQSLRAACAAAGIAVRGPAAYILLWAIRELRRNAGAFMNGSLLDFLLGELATAFPELVRAARARFEPQTLSRVFRLLLAEAVSVRDLRSILDGLLSIRGSIVVDGVDQIVVVPHGPQPVWHGVRGNAGRSAADDLAEALRMVLKRRITQQFGGADAFLLVCLLDPTLEARLADSSRRPLSKGERRRLAAAVSAETGAAAAGDGRLFFVLTTFEVRRPLYDLLRRWLPDVVVLSYQELDATARIQALGRISIE